MVFYEQLGNLAPRVEGSSLCEDALWITGAQCLLKII